MNNKLEMQLDKKQISDLSSVYIDEGLRKDSWEILNIGISGALLTAQLRLTSCFVSPTDSGFHLTIFSTQEFLAQLRDDGKSIASRSRMIPGNARLMSTYIITRDSQRPRK